MGAIRKSFSPWASAVVLVRKKDGGLRFCIDLRKLNNRTIKDGYSLPRIEDTMDCLHGAVWFSTLDLQNLEGSPSQKKKFKVHWGPEQQEAFEALQWLCTESPVLAYPDFKAPFILHTGC